MKYAMLIIIFLLLPFVSADNYVSYYQEEEHKIMDIGDSITVQKPMLIESDAVKKLYNIGKTDYQYKLGHYLETTTFTLNKIEGKEHYFDYEVSYSFIKEDVTTYELPINWYPQVTYRNNFSSDAIAKGIFIAEDKTVKGQNQLGEWFESFTYLEDLENSMTTGNYYYRITPRTLTTSSGRTLSNVTLGIGANYSTMPRDLDECLWDLRDTRLQQNVTYIGEHMAYETQKIVYDFCFEDEKYTVRKARCYLGARKETEPYACPPKYRCHMGQCIPPEDYAALATKEVMYVPSHEEIISSETIYVQPTPAKKGVVHGEQKNANTPGEYVDIQSDAVPEDSNVVERKGLFSSIWHFITTLFS